MSKDDTDRDRRLAEALRQNLRRRKEQARGGVPRAPRSSEEARSGSQDG